MSPRSDDRDVKRRRLPDRTVEALLAGRQVTDEPELTAFVQQLQSLAELPPPAPSTALAALLENGLDLPPVTVVPAAVSWRSRSWALPLQLSLGGAAALSLVLVAAAGNELPAPAQTAVANAVEAVTPLHLPRPKAHHPAPVPTVTPPATPAPTSAPTPHELSGATPPPAEHRSGDPRLTPRPPSSVPDDHHDSGAPSPSSSSSDGGSGGDGGSDGGSGGGETPDGSGH